MDEDGARVRTRSGALVKPYVARDDERGVVLGVGWFIDDERGVREAIAMLVVALGADDDERSALVLVAEAAWMRVFEAMRVDAANGVAADIVEAAAEQVLDDAYLVVLNWGRLGMLERWRARSYDGSDVAAFYGVIVTVVDRRLGEDAELADELIADATTGSRWSRLRRWFR